MKITLKYIIATILICMINLICFSQIEIDTLKTDTTSFLNSNSIYFTPKGWTNDYEKLFSEKEILALDSIISDFERKTTIEIAIVTIDTNACTKNIFDDFTLELARIWGVGKKESKNGILIGISKGARKIRIHNAKGIENLISDLETKEIIQNEIIPEFRLGNYFQGTLKGLERLMGILDERLKK
jgi:uncharacterized protein